MPNHAISKELVERLCGGKLPDGYDWSVVKQFYIEGDRIVPYSDGVALSPDLKITIVPNQDNTETALLRAIE